MSQTEELPDVNIAQEFYSKYEPKEVLGRGISSCVRRCINKKTLEEYAVKIIDLTDKDNQISEELRHVTHNEINILKEVSGQAHIIELVDVFETSTFMFLIFELLRKGELFDYLTEVVKFGEKQTRFAMRTLLEAVSYLHSQNIVHRDLKYDFTVRKGQQPENILLDEDLNLHLSDFGFSTKVDKASYLRELYGTPAYMSPEILKCSVDDEHPGYNKEIDIWACGVIMYTLLGGTSPFWHRRQIIMLRRIMEGTYSFPSPEWDSVSDSAKDLISKMLVVDPCERLTAEEALAHNFFEKVEDTHRYFVKPFDAKRKFKVAIQAVLASVRMQLRMRKLKPLTFRDALRNPYAVKFLRQFIDASAFRIYGHWVKKATDQNRAALFENTSRANQQRMLEIEEKSSLLTLSNGELLNGLSTERNLVSPMVH